MGILTWIVFGFFVGLIARAITPGNQKMGFIKTILLGVAGSFTGGTVGSLLSGYPMNSLHSAGFIGSVIGAIALMLIAGFVGRRRA
ncbi:MAG: GlsB/YeaQ/YmgE family stress response membrane protein [Deltaproteobacteria bacterium]|nr:GlsB/YeaQ/YmgE family stress response membrane protein [Deltaproteobacteria bacterium]